MEGSQRFIRMGRERCRLGDALLGGPFPRFRQGVIARPPALHERIIAKVPGASWSSLWPIVEPILTAF